MSRRAGADRAAENQHTIKNLLKLEGNKVCADCKKNKRTRAYNHRETGWNTDKHQIQDGQAGILASSSAFVALVSIEGWEPISVE